MPTENEPGMPTKGEWHVALAEMVQDTCLACEHGNCVAVRAVAAFLTSPLLRQAMRTQEFINRHSAYAYHVEANYLRANGTTKFAEKFFEELSKLEEK